MAPFLGVPRISAVPRFLDTLSPLFHFTTDLSSGSRNYGPSFSSLDMRTFVFSYAVAVTPSQIPVYALHPFTLRVGGVYGRSVRSQTLLEQEGTLRTLTIPRHASLFHLNYGQVSV
jgi:hypothetical protein